MADNVIRRDVVQIGWEVENNPLGKIVQEVNNLRKSLGAVSDDGISSLAKTAKDSTSKVSSLKDRIQQTVKSLTEGQSGAKGFTNALKNIGKSGLDKLASGAKKAKDALATIAKTSFNALKSGISKLADGIKNVASHAADAAKNLAKCTGKALVTGIGAAVAGIAALGVSSIKSYAQYEQLVGGVETLFKESKDQVMQYANNAYKTAGLSANAYMETVTSFSASLLQSLNGDTAKAAKVADKAITDMSDNANKMGTDMSMIQNAYQGFAKQNYTMLDNLKLGYGGTKEEMQRLLSDAEKLSGQKFDLSSYADIVEAIHVIQNEMGITGTTAKEASETIQGSANAMKGAWQNFLTGMADPAQDFDTLLGNLMDTVVTFGKNLIPRIKVMLPRLTKGIAELANALIPQIPGIMMDMLPALVDGAISLVESLVSTIKSNGSMLINAALTIINQLATFLLKELPTIVTVGAQLLMEFCAGLSNQLPQLVPLAVQAILTIVDGLLASIDSLIVAAIQIINGLVDGLIQNLPLLLTAAMQLIMGIVSGLLNNIQLIINAALNLVNALVQGLLQNLPMLLQAALQLVLGILQGILNNLNLIVDGALMLIQALLTGIIQNLPAIVEMGVQVLVQLILGIINAIPQLLGIIPTIFKAFVDGILSVDWLTLGVDILKSIGNGIVNGVKEFGGTIWNSVKGIFSNDSKGSDAKATGMETMSSYTSGLTSSTPAISTATSSIGSTLSSGLTLDLNTQGLGSMTTYNAGMTTGGNDALTVANGTAMSIQSTFASLDLSESGRNIMSGLVVGMNSMRGAVIAAAEEIATSVKNTINSALAINSPSRVSQWQMEMYGAGFVKGGKNVLPDVRDASSGISDAIYRPETTGTTTTNSSTNNNYAPQFVLNLSGTVDRTTERTVKRWIQEALQDTFDSMGRTSPRLTEV